jgi:septal ring factor EnvC (AmiA/AmiB activator)
MRCLIIWVRARSCQTASRSDNALVDTMSPLRGVQFSSSSKSHLAPLITIVALIAGLFSVVRAFQATQELARTREREAQVAAVYAEIRQLRHELLLIEASPKDLLIELDRTEEQLQNGRSSLEQTRTKLQSLRNELAESQQRSERLGLLYTVIPIRIEKHSSLSGVKLAITGSQAKSGAQDEMNQSYSSL